jgi:hypothetical protein
LLKKCNIKRIDNLFLYKKSWDEVSIKLSDLPQCLQTKEKALISLRALKHGAACFAIIGQILQWI